MKNAFLVFLFAFFLAGCGSESPRSPAFTDDVSEYSREETNDAIDGYFAEYGRWADGLEKEHGQKLLDANNLAAAVGIAKFRLIDKKNTIALDKSNDLGLFYVDIFEDTTLEERVELNAELIDSMDDTLLSMPIMHLYATPFTRGYAHDAALFAEVPELDEYRANRVSRGAIDAYWSYMNAVHPDVSKNFDRLMKEAFAGKVVLTTYTDVSDIDLDDINRHFEWIQLHGMDVIQGKTGADL